MMRAFAAAFLTVAVVILMTETTASAGHGVTQDEKKNEQKKENTTELSVLEKIIEAEDGIFDGAFKVRVDSLTDADIESRYSGLTEEDFKIVAEELGVEIAAIKAVVAIEAGVQMKGFWTPGVPVINFDPKMYSRFRTPAGSREKAVGEKVPEGLTGYALKEWTQLINARKVDARGANLGTFWGMFQIGGFNYDKCGCASVDEFVKLMAYSELEQLELFAAFITNSGMLTDLKNKNWAGFSRKYNGPGYAKRGYHTKMAAAYKKYKAAEKK